MFRLLSRAFGMTFAILVAAVLIGSHHPRPAQADAAAVGAHRSAWAPDPAPGTPQANPLSEPTVIARDAHGRFSTAGSINGRSHELLVDTGADIVAIPVDEAAGLGIVVAPDQFRPILRTASGTASGAQVRIASLTVGARELRDVDAVVVEGLDTVLLGQSALRRLGKVTIEDDHMVIGG